MPRRPTIVWRPPDFAFAHRAEEVLLEVAGNLGLRSRLTFVEVNVRPRVAGDHAAVVWNGRARLRVRLSLDAGNFLTAPGREQLRAVTDLAQLPGARFSRCTLSSTLHHEFAHVADDVLYGIHSAAIPVRRWPAFNEAWNVWIDGRLARAGSPGISRRERWRHFCRTFGRGGGRRAHEAIFHWLWHSDRLTYAELLFLARRLEGGAPAPRVPGWRPRVAAARVRGARREGSRRRVDRSRG